MNNLAVVIPYFGQFKPSAKLFLESCCRNPEIDWLIFTDCSMPEGMTLTENIIWYDTTLEKIKKLGESKLGAEISLEKAYKLCDLKPFYGIIFSDFLEKYDYWGFGDMDVIYGHLFEFLNNIDYTKYDKINWMGHLCFIRNTDECNSVVFSDVNGTVKWQDVLCTGRNIGFDERDYNIKFLDNGLKIYNEKWAADIDVFYWRMRCADRKTFHLLLDTKQIKYAPKNYFYQIFAVLNGRVYRVFLKGKKVCYDEFAYIHFRKEVPVLVPDGCQNYLITRDGFINIEDKYLELNDYNVLKNYIEKYNLQENWKKEIINFLYHFYRKISGKRGW